MMGLSPSLLSGLLGNTGMALTEENQADLLGRSEDMLDGFDRATEGDEDAQRAFEDQLQETVMALAPKVFGSSLPPGLAEMARPFLSGLARMGTQSAIASDGGALDGIPDMLNLTLPAPPPTSSDPTLSSVDHGALVDELD